MVHSVHRNQQPQGVSVQAEGSIYTLWQPTGNHQCHVGARIEGSHHHLSSHVRLVIGTYSPILLNTRVGALTSTMLTLCI